MGGNVGMRAYAEENYRGFFLKTQVIPFGTETVQVEIDLYIISFKVFEIIIIIN